MGTADPSQKELVDQGRDQRRLLRANFLVELKPAGFYIFEVSGGQGDFKAARSDAEQSDVPDARCDLEIVPSDLTDEPPSEVSC